MERRVKKPISTIQCSNSVSLVGRKLFNIFLWQALKTSTKLEYERYNINVDLLLKYTNLKSNNLNYLKNILEKSKELQTTLIEWNILDVIYSSQMIGGIEVNKYSVEYTIPYHLRKLIVDSNMFEMIRLNITKLFKSKYSLALYENCIRYKDVGSTGFISVDDWKKLLGVSNISKYKTTYKFNHYILKPSMKEINEISDINVSQIQKKKGKSIAYIKFVIEKKEGIENVSNIEELKQKELDISSQSPNDEYFQNQLDNLRKLKENLNK